MFTFTFIPYAGDPTWSPDGLPAQIGRTLTANDFTFYYFNTDVIIHDGTHEIRLSTPGALPIMDFTQMLIQLRREVASSGEALVETSLSRDSIKAKKRNDFVDITYSFSDLRSVASMAEFHEIPNRAFDSALRILYSTHSDLQFNRFLLDTLELIRSE